MDRAFRYTQNYHGNEKKFNWKLKRLQQGRIQIFQMEGYTGLRPNFKKTARNLVLKKALEDHF